MNDVMEQFLKIMMKLNEIEKNPIDFGTHEVLYPSEIHMIDAIGDQYETASEISHKFGITKGAVSQVIAKLTQKDYIQKNRNVTNSKEIILSLTVKGVTAYRAHKKLHVEMEQAFYQWCDKYSDESLQKLVEILERFNAQFSQYIHFDVQH